MTRVVKNRGLNNAVIKALKAPNGLPEEFDGHDLLKMMSMTEFPTLVASDCNSAMNYIAHQTNLLIRVRSGVYTYAPHKRPAGARPSGGNGTVSSRIDAALEALVVLEDFARKLKKLEEAGIKLDL